MAVIALLVAAPLAAQEEPQVLAGGPELVDRVVAVVGDSVILESEVQERIERRRAFGETVPTEERALRTLKRQELETLINELVLIQAAQRDSLVMSAEDVQGQVDAALAEQERRFGGEAGFEQALRTEGLTLESYRRTVEQNIRRSGMRQQYLAMLQRDRRPPPVTDAEIRAFFEDRRADLGQRPATVEFEQVVVSPRASEAARLAAREEAAGIREQLMEGAEFEVLARRHSDDPGSRERGGELGWFRRGRMVPAFERVAFALRPGEISPVVETPFGYHIIRVDRVRGPERQASHILIRPDLTPEDQAGTRERADEVAAALRAGASLDSLISAVHDETEESRVGPALRDSLPEPYRTQLQGVSEGEVVGPFTIPASTDAYAVVRVRDLTEAGEYSIDDRELREQIRAFLQQEKLLEEVIGELRRRTYIDIRY